MRNPIAPVLGSIREDAPLVELAGAGLLMDALLAPAARWTDPVTVADLVAALAVPNLDADDFGEVWPCVATGHNDDFDYDTTIGLVGTADLLAVESVTEAGSAILGQRAVGLFNGSDFRSLRAIESVADGSGFYAPDDTLFSPGTADFALLFVFRVAARDTTQRTLIGHAAASHSAGYAIYLESDGTLTWRVRGTGGDRTRTISGNHADGAWHVAVVYRSGSTIGAYTDLTAEVTTSGASGNVNVTGRFFGIGAIQPSSDGARLQCKLAAYMTSAAVAGQRAAILAWWSSSVTAWPSPLGSNVARASSIMSQVGIDGEDGIVLGISASGAPAPIYMPSEDAIFGIQFAPAFTSVVTDSNPANWTQLGSPGLIPRSIDDPRGVRHAALVYKNAGQATGRLSTGVALTNAATYHFAVAYYWNGLATPPVLRLRNPADSSTIATVAGTVANRWAMLILPDVVATSTATFLLQLLASADSDDTSGEVYFQYASGGLGGSYQPLPGLARGGTVASAITTAYVDPNGTGLVGRADKGRIEITATMLGAAGDFPSVLPAARTLAALVSSTSMSRKVEITTARDVRGYAIDNAGGTDVAISGAAPVSQADLTSPRRYGVRWKRPATPVAITVQQDGADLATANGTIDAATDPTRLVIGNATAAGSLSWLGGISRVRVYSVPWTVEPAVMV